MLLFAGALVYWDPSGHPDCSLDHQVHLRLPHLPPHGQQNLLKHDCNGSCFQLKPIFLRCLQWWDSAKGWIIVPPCSARGICSTWIGEQLIQLHLEAQKSTYQLNTTYQTFLW